MEHILEHIPAEDRTTLIACALVAAWWTGPSQRRLFSSVSIHDGNYERWVDSVVHSGVKTRLLGYVRSLQHRRHDPGVRGTYPMGRLTEDSGEYLSALRGVRSLELCHVGIDSISQDDFSNCFSAFRETLTDLTLRHFFASFSTFVTLVGYFPNITTLKLGIFTTIPDEGPVPPLSRPLRGKICVGFTGTECVEFFNRFAKLDLEYEELQVMSSRLCMEPLESVLRLSASTVKYLRLKDEPREYPYDILSSLRI